MSERNIFAVCDLDVDYAYHFMEYLSKKKNIPFEVRVFTSAAGFREYVKEHPENIYPCETRQVPENPSVPEKVREAGKAKKRSSGSVPVRTRRTPAHIQTSGR